MGTLFNGIVAYAAEPVDKPDAPQNLRIVEGSITHNSVELEWDLIENDNNDIQVFYAENDKYIIWGHRGNKVISGFEPETTYRIYITWDSKKPKSNVVEFTTTADTTEYKDAPLPAPLQFQVTDVTESTVSFKWIGSPNANGYDFYANGAWHGVWDGSNTYKYTLKDEQKVEGAELNFYVSAQLAEEEKALITSGSSNVVNLKWGELATPQDVQIITANLNTAVIGWAPVAGATKYNIYQNNQLIGSSTDNRFTAKELQEGQSYSYTVEAINPLWQSDKSEAAVVVPGANYTNVTYFAAWSVYDRKYYPEDVDVTKITHINYAFADLCWQKFGTGSTACESKEIPLQARYVYDGEIVLGDQDKDIENFEAFQQLKAKNPHFKLLVSVGGWSWSKNFSNMAADEVSRRTFAKSAVDFLREYKLDGLDIDWEYPVEGGETHNIHRATDKENFTLLMKTVRAALDAAGSEDNKYYLLTIASGQGDNFVVNADLSQSSNDLDFINIMTYDYGGSWETIANHNSPLYYDPNLPKPNAERNHVLGGVNGHLAGGVPEHKLVLGLPFYGKAWSGCDAPGQYVECSGDYPEGSWEKGIYDYSDILSFIGKDGYVRYWNDAAKVAYLYSPQERIFMTYNDDTSMMYSASLVKTKNLAGVMSWEVSGDRTGGLLNQLNKDLPINGVVNVAALAAPSGLTLSKAYSKALEIKWDSVEGATGYEAYINGRYAGYTEELKFQFNQLSSGTYQLHVLAVSKTEDNITAVSASSDVLSAKTLVVYSGNDDIPVTSQQVLTSAVVKGVDSWTITVDKEAAVSAIKGSANPVFTLAVDAAAPAVDLIIPKEVAEALVAAGANAELKVNWNGKTYVFPAKNLDHGADIRIQLRESDQNSVDSTHRTAVGTLTGAIRINVDVLGTDGVYHSESRINGAKLNIVLPASNIDSKQLKGIVYLPESNTFRPVGTKVITQADGSFNVELDVIAGGVYMVVAVSTHYSDTNLSWANDAIVRALNSLIVFGESDEYFGASSQITRAEFVSIVVRGLGVLPNHEKLTFADVDPKSWYAEDIAIAAMLGIINGKQPNEFDPDGTISRQEMAVVLHRALLLQNKVTEKSDQDLSRFHDREQVSAYALDAIKQLVVQNIMNGVSATRFDPEGTVTKAQAVVAIMRFLDIVEE